MLALHTPNEIVGLRIRTDEHNFVLVLVKKHGPASKYSGQPYDTVLGYYAKLETAVAALIDRATRIRAESSDAEFLASDKRWAEGLRDAIMQAKADAVQALKELSEAKGGL